MIDVDILIVGQGIAGTMLAFELHKNNKSFYVIDNINNDASSLLAAAILNPLVAKKWNISCDTEPLISSATSIYKEMEHFLKVKLVEKIPMFIYFSNDSELTAFESQIKNHNPYLKCQSAMVQEFKSKYDKIGITYATTKLDNQLLLKSWKDFLKINNLVEFSVFQNKELIINNNSIQYKGIKAKNIVFCEGAMAAENCFFPSLPFIKNRGDILTLKIPNLSPDYIYHHSSIRLAPLYEDYFWCGSNYVWDFENLMPDLKWQKRVKETLDCWLKIPYLITDHRVGQRPTTVAQQPLLIRNDRFKNAFLFNGLGTRGFTLAPSLSQKMYNIIFD